MYTSKITLPFHISLYAKNQAEAIGLVNLTPTELQFEYQIELLGGQGRGEIQRLAIALDEIAQVDFKDRWFWAIVVLQSRSLAIVDSMPKSRVGRISLEIHGNDRDLAKRFVRILSQYLIEHDIEQLDMALQAEK
jgi:hypothetical protein